MTLLTENRNEALVNGIKDQCAAVPQSVDGLSIHYEFSVNSKCGNGENVNVKVTMDRESDCNDLVSALSMKESADNCSRNGMNMKRCSLMKSEADSNNNVCMLRCKCTVSANPCILQIYSTGLIQNPPEIKIFEIEIETP